MLNEAALNSDNHGQRRLACAPALLCLLPLFTSLGYWLSPLSFVPVPWPDDAVFFLVANNLLQWPPTWVMGSQAPFEPTYAIVNFNTMPLFPVLVGVGGLLGVGGSFGLKVWGLMTLTISQVLIVRTLIQGCLPCRWAILIAGAVVLNPMLRWGAMVVRPEGIVGLCGVILALGMTFGRYDGLGTRRLWDPAAFILAIAAYTHFNAIHLALIPVFYWLTKPKRLARMAGIVLLYLTPWLGMVFAYWHCFLQQMEVQWSRLNVHNPWLDSLRNSVGELFNNLGSAAPLADEVNVAGVGVLILIACAFVTLIQRTARLRHEENYPKALNLLPSATWVIAAAALWYTHNETWYLYYVHLSTSTFAAVLLLHCWTKRNVYGVAVIVFGACLNGIVFGYVTLVQLRQLLIGDTWRWSTYSGFIECVDSMIMRGRLESPAHHVVKVWNPTYPDVLVELSRRHPNWILTRRNDFRSREPRAYKHAGSVDAVIITQISPWSEENWSGPLDGFASLSIPWLETEGEGAFLAPLVANPAWNPRRYLCQNGKWQALIYMK